MLIPISAPKPYSPPSLNRVDALTMTLAVSTAWANRPAADSSAVIIASVCFEPNVLMCAIAASNPSTIFTARVRFKNSSAQSSSQTGLIFSLSIPAWASIFALAWQTLSSTPAAISSFAKPGSWTWAIVWSISRVSAALHTPGLCVLAFSVIRRAMSGSAAAWM